jgi:hypothetical protein
MGPNNAPRRVDIKHFTGKSVQKNKTQSKKTPRSVIGKYIIYELRSSFFDYVFLFKFFHKNYYYIISKGYSTKTSCTDWLATVTLHARMVGCVAAAVARVC